MLVDHADARGDRVARRSEFDSPAVDPDDPVLRAVEPGEDVHKGALAGPVLAEECMDLARAEVEVDVVVREHAREGLDDADRLEGVR